MYSTYELRYSPLVQRNSL